MPTKLLKKSKTVAEIKLDQPIIKKDYHGSSSVPLLPAPSHNPNLSKNESAKTVKVLTRRKTYANAQSLLGQGSGGDNGQVFNRQRSVIDGNVCITKQESQSKELFNESTHPQRDRPQVGEGNGTYEYDNRFFKYEGQWKNGRKHGTGKLTFTDGSYYEGTFKNGEIEGFGVRYFSNTGCKYQGQFVKGEMHGKGRMTWPDGSIYEGSWANNKRQGYGIIKSVKENSIYKGMYIENKRHGPGTMIYPISCLKSMRRRGDRYDGDWENDLRHGDGDMKFVDGTVYEGHFENDQFCGQGVMRHASGLVYNGNWLEGKPTILPTKLVIVNTTGTEPLEAIQGEPFHITVHCVTGDGQVLEVDSGRELRITAGFKHIKAKKGTALFDLIEEYEEKPMQTPYYEVLQYPLTDFVAEEEAAEDEEVKEEVMAEVDEEKAQAEEEGTPPAAGDTESKPEEGQVTEEKAPEEPSDNPAQPVTTPASNPEGGSQTETTPSVEGTVSVSESTTTLHRIDSTLSDVNSSALSGVDPSLVDKESRPLPPPVVNRRSEEGVCEWRNIQMAQAPPRFPPFVALDEEEKKLRARQNRQVEAKRLNRVALDERFARIGEYVIIVQDVTNPPFMGQTLEPAYITVKLKKKPRKPKKPKEVKPKWDTSKHIEGSMVRS